MNQTLVVLTAFAGLAGALLTQLLTGLFGYYTDKRKANLERANLYRAKQVEVAEQFYFMTGETMSVLRKSVEYWKDKNKQRSEASVAFFNGEMKRLDAYMEKLQAENWKQNLISLYFDVTLSYDRVIAANTRSHALYLGLLDTAERIGKADGEEKERLLGKYHLGLFDLCAQYDDIYKMLAGDMASVKTALLETFR
ncbi:hypothetical protein [Mucilaginibacter sp. AK015]|uniref:hypothetical protein n=1 Tax=Mucilaginibacter sp. AK015 TaxID=2723072 RepID=UPI0016193C9C|nr:hypothetical protein [Mucilaginibacter sp. AK015]MBB5395129.1 hypothetical protein [Mucilaginibacter sp. AK015]